MKKFIMMLVCTFAMHTMVMADNDKPIQVSQLPAKTDIYQDLFQGSQGGNG